MLDRVSGVLKPSRFTVLLGPPGSGKSCLMKALSGQARKDRTLKVGGRQGHALSLYPQGRQSRCVGGRPAGPRFLSLTQGRQSRCAGGWAGGRAGGWVGGSVGLLGCGQFRMALLLLV